MSASVGFVALLAIASCANKQTKARIGAHPYPLLRVHLLVEMRLVCVVLALTFALALLSSRAGQWAWQAILLVSACLVGAEAYYCFRTGSHGDAFLLRQIWQHRRNLVIIARQRGLGAVFLLATGSMGILAFAWLAASATSLPITGADALLATALSATAAVVFSVLLARVSPTAAIDSALWALLQDFFCPAPWEARSVRDRASQLGPFVAASDTPAVAAQAQGRDNVLLVIVESCRALSHLPEGTMPFTEGLSRRAIHAPQFYSVVPHTTVAMVPLLSGVYPAVDGHQALRDSLPEVLRGHGYRTGFFTPASLEFEGKGDLLASMQFDSLVGATQLPRRNSGPRHYLGLHDEDVVDTVHAWMAQQHGQKTPFLAACLTLSSHHPYRFPGSEQITTQAGQRGEKARYLAALAYADKCVRRLVEGVTALGVHDSTWIVVVGDHGQAFGEHGRRYHSAALWDEVIAVPCVIVPPTGRAGPAPARINGLRSQLDLVPTLLEALGLPCHGAYAGQSMFRPAQPDRELFHATWIENQSLSLRRGRFKYIYHHQREVSEYYDLESDPYERVNLVELLSPDERERLSFECLVWRNRCNLQHRSTAR